MTAEKWAPVPGYEGIYEVSDQGGVRSLDRRDSRGHMRRGKVLAAAAASGAHPTVALCRDGKQRSHYVHHLVLTAFAGPRPEGMWACHWNDDPRDNRFENLRWATPSENSLDSLRNGTNHNANVTRCPESHPYSPENTYIHPSGSRICRECTRTRNRANAARRKVA